MVGSLKTCEGGHGLTNKILRKLFSDKSNFTVIEIKEKTLPYQILDRSYLKNPLFKNRNFLNFCY